MVPPFFSLVFCRYFIFFAAHFLSISVGNEATGLSNSMFLSESKDFSSDYSLNIGNGAAPTGTCSSTD